MFLEYLLEPSFLVVAAGTVLIGIAAGMVGSVTVLRGQSLIGDALGHAAYPGIVIAFMLFDVRDPLFSLMGALVFGGTAYFVINLFQKYSVVRPDALMAIVLSSFFGAGVALKSYIQGTPGAAAAQLQTYIFGQAAFLRDAELAIIVLVCALILILFVLFYKEIKLFVFDPSYASVSGFSSRLISSITLVMTLSLISVGLKAVGAVLIAAVLIAPVVAARQWSNSFLQMVILASTFAGVSAFFGSVLSRFVAGFSTGPSIIVCLSVFAFVSLLFSPDGIIRKLHTRQLNKKRLIARACKEAKHA